MDNIGEHTGRAIGLAIHHSLPSGLGRSECAAVAPQGEPSFPSRGHSRTGHFASSPHETQGMHLWPGFAGYSSTMP